MPLFWPAAKIKASEAIYLFGKLIVYKSCLSDFANLFLICKIQTLDEVKPQGLILVRIPSVASDRKPNSN